MDHGVLVYRSSLRKLDTSANQVCASLDKVCASGKLLSFSVAGTAGRCGQSTLCIGCLLAHPLKISAKIVDASKCGIAHHDGVKHAPQSNINSMAMVHADERAYSPTAAQHMASNAPHTSSADTSPTIYRFAISPNVRNMA